MAQANYVYQFEIGSLKNFIYLVLDSATQTAALIDPQSDFSKPVAKLKELGFTLTEIWLTHTHHDHVAGLEPLLARHPKLKVRVGARDLHRLKGDASQRPGFQIIDRDSSFKLGELTVQVILTPGHSAGAVTFFIDSQAGAAYPSVFTGDTIFIRDCGRTDFDSGSNEEMFTSIQRVKQLPDETKVWVGHHYAPETETTIALEKKMSPPFQVKSVAELAALP